ncbi:MAG: hypothetical protein Kow00121_32430 [Elainellaceae cyanobacterium]
MARYTNLFTASGSAQDLRRSAARVLQACDLNLIYEATDYVVAKEKPGQVTYSQLATVEVLINSSPNEVDSRVNLVVKNEELPLRTNNHCQRVFESVSQAIAQMHNWQAV